MESPVHSLAREGTAPWVTISSTFLSGAKPTHEMKMQISEDGGEDEYQLKGNRTPPWASFPWGVAFEPYSLSRCTLRLVHAPSSVSRCSFLDASWQLAHSHHPMCRKDTFCCVLSMRCQWAALRDNSGCSTSVCLAPYWWQVGSKVLRDLLAQWKSCSCKYYC